MKHVIVIFAILTTFSSVAQQSITLDECYNLVAKIIP